MTKRSVNANVARANPGIPGGDESKSATKTFNSSNVTLSAENFSMSNTRVSRAYVYAFKMSVHMSRNGNKTSRTTYTIKTQLVLLPSGFAAVSDAPAYRSVAIAIG